MTVIDILQLSLMLHTEVFGQENTKFLRLLEKQRALFLTRTQILDFSATILDVEIIRF